LFHGDLQLQLARFLDGTSKSPAEKIQVKKQIVKTK
jgi:hypothetical protein